MLVSLLCSVRTTCLRASDVKINGVAVFVCGQAASLTVHGHAHCNALLEAAELTLVAGNLVDDAAAIVLTGVGRVEVLLDGPTEETLRTGDSEGDRFTGD